MKLNAASLKALLTAVAHGTPRLAVSRAPIRRLIGALEIRGAIHSRLPQILRYSKEFFKYGLALESGGSTPEETRFTTRLAVKAQENRLSLPLLIIAEGLHPLAGIASSVLTGLEPFAEILVPPAAYAKLVSWVGKRENLDKLISALED